MRIICFHNPEEENGYLSNWYPSAFTAGGISFTSMEQFMMYCKAVCFADRETAGQILNTEDVGEIKALGRQVAGYEDSVWAGLRQIVVYEGLKEKFLQNPELGERLCRTGEALFAECAVKDRVWGIGLSMADPARFHLDKWRGQNLLGYALMAVRRGLREEGLKEN